MITLRRVSKTFATPDGPLIAVADASLQVEEGDIYGFIGFRGAGKSALSRTIISWSLPTLIHAQASS